MAERDEQRPRQIVTMIFLEHAQMPDMKRLKERFGERLLFVGLQGSYARGEATEGSEAVRQSAVAARR